MPVAVLFTETAPLCTADSEFMEQYRTQLHSHPVPPVAVLWARQQLVVARPEAAARAEDHRDHRRRRVLRALCSRRPREGPERHLRSK